MRLAQKWQPNFAQFFALVKFEEGGREKAKCPSRLYLQFSLEANS